MLSICIPVFNYDVRELINSLVKQINENQMNAEVIILDDGSSKSFKELNKELKELNFVKYFEQTNSGRSITRNNLAKNAIGQNIIFIDCDCLINENYLLNYKSYIHSPVVIGGLKYGNKPKDKELLLRWRYGIKRECKVNYSHDNIGFLSSNFMIDKELFDSVGFDQSLREYGHEDTLLGIRLREKGIQIKQINNPVIHMGLDNTETFINKTEYAIENFLYLLNEPIQLQALSNNGITKLFKLDTPRWINLLLSQTFKFCKTMIRFVLKNIYPSLILFDIYKGLYIFHLKSNFSSE